MNIGIFWFHGICSGFIPFMADAMSVPAACVPAGICAMIRDQAEELVTERVRCEVKYMGITFWVLSEK